MQANVMELHAAAEELQPSAATPAEEDPRFAETFAEIGWLRRQLGIEEHRGDVPTWLSLTLPSATSASRKSRSQKHNADRFL